MKKRVLNINSKFKSKWRFYSKYKWNELTLNINIIPILSKVGLIQYGFVLSQREENNYDDQ